MSEKTALLVIDVQNAMFDPTYPVWAGELLLERLQGLIGKAREAGAPVIYVRHDEGSSGPLEAGTEGWQIHPAIAPAPGDLLVDKRRPDAFQGTDLQAQLEALGVERLVLSGMQTDVCVDTTCRRAYSLGYRVTLVEDGHSTWDAGQLTAEQIIAHHNQVLRWFARVSPAAEVQF